MICCESALCQPEHLRLTVLITDALRKTCEVIMDPPPTPGDTGKASGALQTGKCKERSADLRDWAELLIEHSYAHGEDSKLKVDTEMFLHLLMTMQEVNCTTVAAYRACPGPDAMLDLQVLSPFANLTSTPANTVHALAAYHKVEAELHKTHDHLDIRPTDAQPRSSPTPLPHHPTAIGASPAQPSIRSWARRTLSSIKRLTLLSLSRGIRVNPSVHTEHSLSKERKEFALDGHEHEAHMTSRMARRYSH